MAILKPVPEEEPNKRSPGKYKFVFPKKDAPPVDNSYFDRLFSELDQQRQEPVAPVTEPPLESPATEISERPTDQTKLGAAESASLPESGETSSTPIDDSVGESSSQDITLHLEDAVIGSRAPEFIEPASFDTIPQPEPTEPFELGDHSQLCKPETSIYVDKLKLTYRLSKGEANVLRYLLGASLDQGNTDCYISIPKLAEAASLTPRGCQLTLKSLQIRGFVVRIEEYHPANRLGIKLRVKLISI